eukprot:scaffold4056_cov110-Isochrysis_galbana.AAC.2
MRDLKGRVPNTLAAARRITDCPLPSGHSPSPFPIVPHPFSLFRPPFAGGWMVPQSCVHYNSLGLVPKSLGFIVVLYLCPHQSRSTSLRADYGLWMSILLNGDIIWLG